MYCITGGVSVHLGKTARNCTWFQSSVWFLCTTHHHFQNVGICHLEQYRIHCSKNSSLFDGIMSSHCWSRSLHTTLHFQNLEIHHRVTESSSVISYHLTGAVTLLLSNKDNLKFIDKLPSYIRYLLELYPLLRHGKGSFWQIWGCEFQTVSILVYLEKWYKFKHF